LLACCSQSRYPLLIASSSLPSGDTLAQRTEIQRNSTIRWDSRRSLACFLDGLVCTGPLLHFSYGWLERHLPSRGGSIRNAVMSVAVDELICDPLDVAVYLTSTSVSPQRVFESWCTDCPVHCIRLICPLISEKKPYASGSSFTFTHVQLVEGKSVQNRLREKYWPTLRDGLSVSLVLVPFQVTRKPAKSRCQIPV
jgi:hypothetical protein